jgi:hypothetical protein
MVEQVIGTATVAVLVLTWLLIAQAMTAAVLVLSQFIVVEVRTLRTSVAVLGDRPQASPELAPIVHQGESYRLGGDIKKLE